MAQFVKMMGPRQSSEKNPDGLPQGSSNATSNEAAASRVKTHLEIQVQPQWGDQEPSGGRRRGAGGVGSGKTVVRGMVAWARGVVTIGLLGRLRSAPATPPAASPHGGRVAVAAAVVGERQQGSQSGPVRGSSSKKSGLRITAVYTFK